MTILQNEASPLKEQLKIKGEINDLDILEVTDNRVIEDLNKGEAISGKVRLIKALSSIFQVAAKLPPQAFSSSSSR